MEHHLMQLLAQEIAVAIRESISEVLDPIAAALVRERRPVAHATETRVCGV